MRELFGTEPPHPKSDKQNSGAFSQSLERGGTNDDGEPW